MLLTDDEVIITMASGDALLDAGYDVMLAHDAPSAIAILDAHPGHFSCLVTDYHMPGELNGADLVEHMRKSYPSIPMVITTGRPDVVTPQWRAKFGVKLLSKPYTPTELVAAIQNFTDTPTA